MSECCTGVNGSHTALCPENIGQTVHCWCCGLPFPADHAALWSAKGSRCFDCEGHDEPCDPDYATEPPK